MSTAVAGSVSKLAKRSNEGEQLTVRNRDESTIEKAPVAEHDDPLIHEVLKAIVKDGDLFLLVGRL